MSLGSSVVQRWDTGWMIGDSGPGRGWDFFSSPPTQPPIQWVPGGKAAGAWIYNSTPPISLHGVVLTKRSTGTTLPLFT